MKFDNRIEQLLSAPSDVERRLLWRAYLSEFAPSEFAQALKQSYSIKMHTDPQEALRVTGLMRELGGISAEPTIDALALRSEANIRSIALGQHQHALDLFAQASQIYAAHNQTVEIARVQSGRIWALSNLDRYTEAVESGEWAYPILQSHQQWTSLSILVNNMAMVHIRYGKPQQSLPLLESARDQLAQAGDAVRHHWVGNAINHIYVLSLLGRFSEAQQLESETLAAAQNLNQPVLVAMIKNNAAISYSLSGQFNRALQLYDEATDIWKSVGWTQGWIQAELAATRCLLHLRRFWDVIQRFERVHTLCQRFNVLPETPYMLLWEAKAYAGLQQYNEALAKVDKVANLIAPATENVFASAVVDLTRAELLIQQKAWSACIKLMRRVVVMFKRDQHPVEYAEALLLLARALFASNAFVQAHEAIQGSLDVARQHQFHHIEFAAEALLGRMAVEPMTAYVHFARALAWLRQLQAGVMLEFRPNFLQDSEKRTVYEEMVRVCVACNRIDEALYYVEETKSRSLLAMVAQRVTLRLEARDERDRPLIAKMQRLIEQRNALYRQLQRDQEEQKINRDVLLAEQQTIEAQVTDLRHTLLIRSADYARDLSLMEIHVEAAQPHVPSDTLLVEYFVVEGRLIAFCVSAETTTVHSLPVPFNQVQRTQYALNVNFKTIPRLPVSRIVAMTKHAQKVLGTLYQQLIAPLAEKIGRFKRLIIVPHASLHYLPFHALFDGQRYLIETHELSYLPASSFLAYTQPSADRVGKGMLAIGYSHGGMLPHAVAEATRIAAEWQADLLVEDEATRTTVLTAMRDCRMLHFATHGEFHADNPLFSGLALQDGWLTTLDIFNQQLQASLVTLSGCYTGRSMIGGGDELLGLTRAFLAAGASSLVLSHWAVEDVSTATLMHQFYTHLHAGVSKGQALQQAQHYLLAADQLPTYLRHPYFWAPFYLVGASDVL